MINRHNFNKKKIALAATYLLPEKYNYINESSLGLNAEWKPRNYLCRSKFPHSTLRHEGFSLLLSYVANRQTELLSMWAGEQIYKPGVSGSEMNPRCSGTIHRLGMTLQHCMLPSPSMAKKQSKTSQNKRCHFQYQTIPICWITVNTHFIKRM